MTKEEIMKALVAEPEENTPKVNKREIFEPNKEMLRQLTDAIRISDPEEQFAKLVSILSVSIDNNPDLAEAMKTHAIQYGEFCPEVFSICYYGITFSEKGYMTFGIVLSLSGIRICCHRSEMDEGLKLTPWKDGFSVEKLVSLIDAKRKEFQKNYNYIRGHLLKEGIVADAIIKTMGVN